MLAKAPEASFTHSCFGDFANAGESCCLRCVRRAAAVVVKRSDSGPPIGAQGRNSKLGTTSRPGVPS